MLTRKQHQLLAYIDAYLKDHGISPSFDEMKAALGLKSKSGIHRLITGLEERGFIRRLPHRARALEVLRRADAPPPPPRPAAANDDSHAACALPLYGRIAAGTPIEALSDRSTYIDVPAAMLGPGRHYALEVSGDSMIEAGILNGDTIVIQEAATAPNGTIVVALVDEAEATLKRFKLIDGAVHLQPANRDYDTQVLSPERVRIQGRLIGLVRRY